MQGLNTEVDPTLLGRKGAEAGFAQFMRLTLSGGVVKPVASDGTHATAVFAEQQLGTSIVSDPFPINSVGGFQAYTPQAGGTAILRGSNGSTYPIALPAPTSAPTATTATLTAGGLISGAAPVYAAAWGNSLMHGGLGSVATVGPYALHVAFLSAASGAAPTGRFDSGATVTFGTATDAPTALTVDSRISGINTYYYLLLQNLSGTVASGAVATWGSGTTAGTATMAVAALPLDGSLYIVNAPRASMRPPVGETVTSSSGGTGTVAYQWGLTTQGAVWLHGITGTFAAGDTITWGTGTTAVWDGAAAPWGAAPVLALSGTTATASFYRLDTTGTWRQVSSPDTTTDATLPEADAYDGPLDAEGSPLSLVVPGACQTLAAHKGCLFVGEGSLMRWSEGMLTGAEVGWYREGYTLDAGGTVWAFVSRGEVLEVYTSAGIKYVVGNAPYFEIRDSQINERPVSRFSIVPTDRGTIYQGADGLRMLAGGSSKLLSGGWNTPWFAAITDPTSTVAGASLGRYFLADSAGRGLVWDWETEEWSERTWTAQPAGFRWSPAGRYLVAKVGSSYLSVEQGTTAVSWAIQYPTRSLSLNRPLPGYVWLDNEGAMTLDVYVDGTLFQSLPIYGSTKGRVRLPNTRGVAWHLVVRGTGTPTTSKIRSLIL